MTLQEKIKKVHDLNTAKEVKVAEQTKLQEEITALDTEAGILLTEILSEMKSSESTEVKVDDLVAQYFCKNEFSYGDEKALLNYLIKNKMNKYVTTKITQSINKKDLKKDLKLDSSLKESLSTFVGDKTTEYVVVTTEEKHQRMLEHIEETMKGK